MTTPEFSPQTVLDLWFPDTAHWECMEDHGAFWFERMQGGMDQIIIDQFADLTRAAARGALDHWAETPRGRLALLIALDQFPRSLWRGTPGAYAQDIKACRLALEGIRNGHFDGLAPWEKSFFVIAISHCEGPDHLDRMRMITGLAEELIAQMPAPIEAMGPGFRAQNVRVTGIIQRFGRHPHRNAILGRVSTPEEEAYIAEGDFPHVRSEPPG